MFSFNEIGEILINHKIDSISLSKDYFKNEQCTPDYSIESRFGQILFYDSKTKYVFAFKLMKLNICSINCLDEGEYVIFNYDPENICLEIVFEESPVSSVNPYDSLNLKIEGPAIIIHKNYIHTLKINNDIINKPNFIPTRKLELYFDNRQFNYVNLYEYLLNLDSSLSIKLEIKSINLYMHQGIKNLLDSIFRL